MPDLTVSLREVTEGDDGRVTGIMTLRGHIAKNCGERLGAADPRDQGSAIGYGGGKDSAQQPRSARKP